LRREPPTSVQCRQPLVPSQIGYARPPEKYASWARVVQAMFSRARESGWTQKPGRVALESAHRGTLILGRAPIDVEVDELHRAHDGPSDQRAIQEVALHPDSDRSGDQRE